MVLGAANIGASTFLEKNDCTRSQLAAQVSSYQKHVSLFSTSSHDICQNCEITAALFLVLANNGALADNASASAKLVAPEFWCQHRDTLCHAAKGCSQIVRWM
jgi:hypothetical protein